MKKIKLSNIIISQIPGDWGKDKYESNYTNKVTCIRGTDLNYLNLQLTSLAPIRFIHQNKLNRLLSRGNIIIEISGGSPTQSTGRVGIILDQSNIICSNFCRALVINSNHDPFFVFYFLRYLYNSNIFFNFEGKTTGIKNLLLDQLLSSVSIPDIGLENQLKISDVLRSIDNKISLNIKINMELESLAKTIYDYWFVQFDFPDENGKPYKSSGGEMVWNEELKKEIPKDWEVCDLENLLSLNTRGISPKYSTSGTAVLNQKCIRNGTIVEEGIQFHNDEKIAPEWAYLKPYDILINSMGVGTLGRISQTFLKRDTKYLIHSCITLLRTNNKIHPILLGFIIKNLQTKIENMGTGSTGQTSLSNKNLGKIKVVLPITIIQNKFIDITKPILEKVDMNYIQNEELAKLRNFLLPLLMNGQIKIND